MAFLAVAVNVLHLPSSKGLQHVPELTTLHTSAFFNVEMEINVAVEDRVDPAIGPGAADLAEVIRGATGQGYTRCGQGSGDDHFASGQARR